MLLRLLIPLAILCSTSSAAAAIEPDNTIATKSIANDKITFPSLPEVIDVLLLRDYNARLVVISTSILGVAAGLIGSFLLLRKRSLMGDALSHATLPGVCLAFMLMAALGGTGKFLPGLLLGAAVTGLLGVAAVAVIARYTRLQDDAALGIVLSVFFGLGVALIKPVTEMPGGDSAGIESFIYGKTASLIWNDFLLICVVTGVVIITCVALFKEFTLLCFDDGYAKAQGWPTGLLDAAMLGLVTMVTVVGLQAVGLILVIALLIIPPAAARFWTEHLAKLAVIAAFIGALSGWLGATLSALIEGLPAGAIIVVVAAVIFGFSMLLGTSRGVFIRLAKQVHLSRTVGRQHLLRALYELTESSPPGTSRHVTFSNLLAMRSWSPATLRRALRSARREELVTQDARGFWNLTETGRVDAVRMVRNHRLWELYLITHADIAPSHVDRDADMIEHVLGPVMVAKLEKILAEKTKMPESPHVI
jgi:manganese/zinc/iron transport system permease protein